jgi:hypothetical protein
MHVPMLDRVRSLRRGGAGGRPALRRTWRMAIAAAAATLVSLPLAPLPAQADLAPSFTLVWIRCQDQNESFSDEPYVKVNGVTVRQFSDVDTGETKYFIPFEPTQFDPNEPWNGYYAEIQMWESDGFWSLDDYLGTNYIFADEAPGQHEFYFFSSQGEYIMSYNINSS